MASRVGSTSPRSYFTPASDRNAFIFWEIVSNKLEEISKKTNQPATLKDITDLSLCGYDLTALPPEIERLKNLQVIFLWCNRFDYFPSVLLKLQKLQLIHMDEGISVPPIPPHGLQIIQMNLRS